MGNFDALWLAESNAIICNRKSLQSFVVKHTNKDGIPTITVRGKIREVCWKSIGAGLYRVCTKAY